MSSSVLAGAAPRSHTSASGAGVLAVHGFTGTPASMRPVADAVVAAGFDLEQPLLPGHGTSIGHMVPMRWSDWLDATEAAYARLADRTERVVIVGQSMGATLALATALTRPVAGLVLINPLAMPRSDDEIEMIDELLESELEIAPGGGSDIADPEAFDVGYDGTPLAAIRSVLVDGVAPLAERYAELTVPLLLFTSRHDHVVEPANSVALAERYGGVVDHRWLDRSYHVAAIDYDRDDIAAATVEFVAEVTR